MIEMPVLQDIPVPWRHPAETRMDDSQLVGRCRGETLNEFDHDLPIPFPTEAGRAEGARRGLDFPFWPWKAVDGKVSQDRATDSTGEFALEFPLAQSHTQATG
jgi:hypothetical protein